MGERTEHAPGSFSWAELATSDAAGAKAFYEGLFGWETEDMPAGEAGTYTMARQEGQWVAALFETDDQPPHWNSYVTVEDAGETAGRAADAGGNVITPAFDVMDAGRMAVLQDPTGAVFMAWEPRKHIGAGLVNAHGALVWNELATTDAERAKAFYAELFGWTYEPAPGDMPYTMVRNGSSLNAGISGLSSEEQGEPPNWSVCFGANSVDEAAAFAGANGGAAIVPPTDSPIGRFAVLRDPQGAVFAVFDGEMDP
jgi:predicted enzyme related to lactoylglutathione lyase